jgi:hypothetical protein
MNVSGIEYSGVEMILPDLILPSRVNKRWPYSGLDSPQCCLNKQHFDAYPYEVNYVYNSRGFRDTEWPTDIKELQQAIWCVGDSFTVGVGQPFDHIWPQVLSRRLNQRTINVSMDGASNDWIVRRAWDIIDAVKPKYMIVMWSYTHRAESDRRDLSDEDRRMHSSKDSSAQDLMRYISYVKSLKSAPCHVIQTTIPNFDHNSTSLVTRAEKIWDRVRDPSWPDCPQNLNELYNLDLSIRKELKDMHKCYDLLQTILSVSDYWSKFVLDTDVIAIIDQLDRARDDHHFDILTSQWLIDQIVPLMT